MRKIILTKLKNGVKPSVEERLFSEDPVLESDKEDSENKEKLQPNTRSKRQRPPETRKENGTLENPYKKSYSIDVSRKEKKSKQGTEPHEKKKNRKSPPNPLENPYKKKFSKAKQSQPKIPSKRREEAEEAFIKSLINNSEIDGALIKSLMKDNDIQLLLGKMELLEAKPLDPPKNPLLNHLFEEAKKYLVSKLSSPDNDENLKLKELPAIPVDYRKPLLYSPPLPDSRFPPHLLIIKPLPGGGYNSGLEIFRQLKKDRVHRSQNFSVTAMEKGEISRFLLKSDRNEEWEGFCNIKFPSALGKSRSVKMGSEEMIIPLANESYPLGTIAIYGQRIIEFLNIYLYRCVKNQIVIWLENQCSSQKKVGIREKAQSKSFINQLSAENEQANNSALSSFEKPRNNFNFFGSPLKEKILPESGANSPEKFIRAENDEPRNDKPQPPSFFEATKKRDRDYYEISDEEHITVEENQPKHQNLG